MNASIALPFRCVDACVLSGSGEKVAALVNSGTILILELSSPGAYAIQKRIKLPYDCSRLLADGDRILAGGSGGLATVDSRTGRVDHFCTTPIGSRWACVVAAGSVYFGSGSHLMKSTLPPR